MESDTPQPSEGPDISFITTEELIQELANRSLAYVVALVPKISDTPVHAGYLLSCGGGPAHSLGLLAVMDTKIRGAINACDARASGDTGYDDFPDL